MLNFLSGWKIVIIRLIKLILLIAIPLFLLRIGLYIYQSPQKSDKIYSEGIKFYNSSDYSNAYYNFSKVLFTSNLKPLAIYRQALSAEKLGDTKSAIKQYKFFLALYPKHVLSIRVRYNLAQVLLTDNPSAAKKHFSYIVKHHPNSDYATASEYFLGTLLIKKYEKEKIFPLSAKNDIQMNFRHYLKKAPSGRLALQVIDAWSNLDAEISPEDYLLMAKSAYLFNDYEKTDSLISKSEQKYTWALEVRNAVAQGNNAKARTIIEEGLKSSDNTVDSEDIKAAIDDYMSTVPSKYLAASYLFGIAKTKEKDYLLDIKCNYAPSNEKVDCFKNLYLWFPEGEYADDAQAQIFLELYRVNKIADAQRIGIEFLNKYRHTSSYAPMVMYYMGKVSEVSRAYKDYMSYYKDVMRNYPDSYYAYRAYLRTKRDRVFLIASFIKPLEIEFPYPRGHAFLDKLLELGDYEILDEYTAYDDFVKSWALYKRGDKSQAMLIARDAMDKLEEKPDRTDLRWRLVYPVFYFDDIQKSAGMAGVNAPLMLSIAREESYFNPLAQSVVNARGLMQLMPDTAAGVASSLGMTNYTLFSPEDNTKLGCKYYSQIRGELNGQDIFAVAAYNGGIGAVKQWINSLGSDTDNVVEHIPYPETKNYVKKVMRSYWNYVRLYDGNN